MQDHNRKDPWQVVAGLFFSNSFFDDISGRIFTSAIR